MQGQDSPFAREGLSFQFLGVKSGSFTVIFQKNVN